MSLTPNDSRHAIQIQAGIAGRIAGQLLTQFLHDNSVD
jgi:hypothetical protein